MTQLELFIVDKNDSSWSMRPWLLLVHHAIPFVETSFIAADPDTPRKIREVSPTGRVPALRVGSRIVWESLAIIETLSDLHPELAIWPREREARMHARSIAAEMHAGFFELRRYCPMNLALETQIELDPARRAELDRFERMVEAARAEHAAKGPFLFGEFCAADAMLAPVATRIVSYGLSVGPVTRAWIDAVYALPAFQRFQAEAARERGERPPAQAIGQPLKGCTLEQRVPEGPCYAVIFTSQRAHETSDYAATAQRMEALAQKAPGYLGHESARDAAGLGITVSYWSSLEAIAEFGKHAEHASAQRTGRERYYTRYELRVARVERRAHFSAAEPT